MNVQVNHRGQRRNAIHQHYLDLGKHAQPEHRDLSPGAQLLLRLTSWSPSRAAATAEAWNLGQAEVR